jgi:hypothetical protein
MDKKALIKALRDTVQSASNSVASGVSAPVDLIAAGLRKVGMPIPQAPVGGSQWMENMGLTVPVEDGIPKMAGDFLGMTVPIIAAAKAPQIAAAANRGLDNLAAPDTLNTPGFRGQRGAIVWHGSPHKFDAFDASKIGTGEGAQAYGHGMYFAESPGVAREYQKNVTALRMPTDTFADEEVAAAKKLLVVFGQKDGAQQVKRMFGSRADEVLAKANDVTGQLYKVDLPDEAIARMLDWDKPLSQQPNVIKTLQKEYAPSYIAQFMDRPGSDLYKAISGGNGVEDLRASGAAELAKQGIPGIRYLDQGSRGAGAGTSNFVVFPGEERLLRILERNNQPMGLMGVK